jgi:hypothetical protein
MSRHQRPLRSSAIVSSRKCRPRDLLAHVAHLLGGLREQHTGKDPLQLKPPDLTNFLASACDLKFTIRKPLLPGDPAELPVMLRCNTPGDVLLHPLHLAAFIMNSRACMAHVVEARVAERERGPPSAPQQHQLGQRQRRHAPQQRKAEFKHVRGAAATAKATAGARS